MRAGRRAGVGVLILACAFALAGCAGPRKATELSFLSGSDERAAGPALRFRWSLALDQELRSRSVPVEQAAPGIDREGGRVFIGSTRGVLLALDADGKQIFRLDMPGAIEAEPTIDGATGEVYVATVTGDVLALDADTGEERWRAQVGSSVSRPGLLRSDALYLVTDEDTVLALARNTGEILWRYRRDPRSGFGITGHAGLAAAGHRLLTGFSDGTVAALDAGDGRVLWETDTSVDLEDLDETRRFVDVDTTPVVAGDLVFAASFSGGLYAMELDSGTVTHHDAELLGVTGLAADQDSLVVSSADKGIVTLDLRSLTPRWTRHVERGAPGQPIIAGNRVFIPESRGALLALSLADGSEVGRLETAHGITAGPSLAGGLGFTLSNGGTLYAFAYPY
ncbi:MAG: PQQ-binding-like beta-propeller repeat protein [Myxococcales bacterium]